MLLFHLCKFLNDMDSAVNAGGTAVDTQVVASGIAPLLAGVVVVVAGPLLVSLNHDVLRLGLGGVVQLF